MILFCIPYAGGGTEVFAGWKEALAPTADVRVAELPGRGARFGQRLIEDMPTLVAELAEQCEDLSEDPFAVLGYSFGSTAAYALTLRLQQRGRTPRRLFVGGSRAPFLPRLEPIRHLMADAELVAELGALNGTAPEVLASPDLMSMYLPILRADFKVVETYQPIRERVHCPLTLFGASRDQFVSTEDLSAWAQLGGTDDTEVRIYDGGHFVIHSERARICRAVRADLMLDALNAAS
ncbi:thioesterase II family protein [Streptomyces sp. 8N616]|uniref:thioesterase II family protein n=1 Tax=Streptomyces sp. 8N616 TaxID=3457414 RepID=UPI003FD4C00F